MLGKASEIKTAEMWHRNLDEWLKDNPDALIIDIKYTLAADNDAAVLIIYKEAKSHGN